MRTRSSGRSARRFVSGVALAMSAALVLVGCAGIPRSGEVHVGDHSAADGDIELDFLPSSPQKDATTDQILRGFIEAASSPINDYAIAREFLAPGTKWDPTAATTIDQGRRQYIANGEEEMELTVIPIAEVDALGEYRQIDGVAPVPLDFTFAKVGGQWRISEVPDGILLDLVTFNEVFSTHPLYFFDPGFNYLVPDLRWFPRRESTPTRIVKALLQGPAEWLSGGVVSAFPEGSTLTADAVQVIARDAKVDLGSEAFQAERPTLQRMKLQLKASLVSSSATGISTVTLSIDQAVQDIPELTGTTVLANPRIDARALIYRDGAFGFLPATGTDLVPVTGISSPLASLQPLAVTLSANQQSAAVLNGDGVYLLNRGEGPALADDRAGLIPPALDNLGYVWSVPAGAPSALHAFSAELGSVEVPTTWPEASEIVSFALSRDGTRVVALLRSGKDTLLVAAVVLRGERNVPVGLGPPLPVAAGEGIALDVTWVDELTVATLSDLGDGTSQVVTHQLGGRSTNRGAVSDGLWVSAGNTSRDLRVLDSAGNLQTQRGQGWQVRIDSVTFVATQQGLPH